MKKREEIDRRGEGERKRNIVCNANIIEKIEREKHTICHTYMSLRVCVCVCRGEKKIKDLKRNDRSLRIQSVMLKDNNYVKFSNELMNNEREVCFK